MNIKPITSNRGWLGSEMADQACWQFQLDDNDLDELVEALLYAHQSNPTALTVSKQDFPLSGLLPKLQRMATELESGCGFVRLRGLPVNRWSDEELGFIWMGLAQYFGSPVSQNHQGQLLREIRSESGDVGLRYGQLDTGQKQFLSSRARTASNAALRYHTDRCDIVGLLCTGVSESGGGSKLASAVAVHNTMLDEEPALCKLLYAPLPRSRVGEEQGGDRAWYALPVWAVQDGWFTSHYSRTYVEALAHVSGAPAITSKQWQAMDALADLAEKQHLSMQLAPGDIQLLNNHVIYHAREAFQDNPENQQQRCLWRVWLSAPIRPLPKDHAVLWRQTDPGRVRGGIAIG